MKLHVMSDIHLEHAEYDIPVVDCDMVVLAGDIHPGKAGMRWAKEQQKRLKKPIIYIAGNHEFYGNAIPKLYDELREECKEGDVYFLEQDYIDWTNDKNPEENVRLMGATLWTDFDLYGPSTKFQSQMIASGAMPDYSQIRVSTDGYRKFKTTDSMAIHKETTDWLQRGFNTPFKGKKVVITHHLPSESAIAEEYVGSLLNPAFASNLDAYFKLFDIDLWIFGHTHSPCDYMIKNTHLICNPRGYPHERGNKFNPTLVVEV